MHKIGVYRYHHRIVVYLARNIHQVAELTLSPLCLRVNSKCYSLYKKTPDPNIIQDKTTSTHLTTYCIMSLLLPRCKCLKPVLRLTCLRLPSLNYFVQCHTGGSCHY